MKRVCALLRVFGLALVILSLAGVVAARRAEAHFTEVLRGFGEQLGALQGLSLSSTPRKLFVNGLELRVVTATTTLPVFDALNRFQSLCHSVGQVDVPATVKQKLEAANGSGFLSSAGVLRQEAKNEGFLGCLDTGERLDGETLLARLTEFGKTGDLQSLGQLRYTLARRHGNQTTLLMFWTEGSTQLHGMFPRTGDAPGRDLADVPRPEHSRRLLSASELGQPYGLVFYRVEGRLEAVAAAYRDVLRRQGWVVQEPLKREITARKGGRTLAVRVSEKRAGQVVVGLSELG
jgi:hypothetical protein